MAETEIIGGRNVASHAKIIRYNITGIIIV